ncbi:MAG: dioxygenase [Pseudomonadota bacterium]
MRSVSLDTITEVVAKTIEGSAEPRLKEILDILVRHLHEIVKEAKLTHQEWEYAVDFLYRVGQMSDENRQEFILLSDILGVTSTVDLVNSDNNASESSVLGPFYVADPPDLPVGGDMIKGQPGQSVLVEGMIRGADGEPLGGAVMDIWQNADNGLYDVQEPDREGYNLRCRMVANGQGVYQFTTVRPKPYTVPDDGPVGDLLRAAGRHPWRPAHLHLRISKDGYRELITELFDSEDTYVDEDAVFGVRESLVCDYVETNDADEATRYGLPNPYLKLVHNFTLAPKD